MLRLAAATPVPTAVLDERPAPSEFGLPIGGRDLIADIPFLTAGLIVFLLLIYAVETRLAFDATKDGELSLLSLIAFGATSRDLVIGSGEWWRIGLAPLLHASTSHLLGNCVGLFFVGVRLEPMIGRGWFALIFVLSAVGGVAGSLYGNPPNIPGVGASGAITGLVGALFVVSFNPFADPDQQRSMRRTALFFGVPALLPLAFGATGNVDYFGHAGGAIAGGAIALILCADWSADHVRAQFARPAAMVALTGLVASTVCCAFAGNRYAGYAADAAQFIRSSELPATFKAGGPRSAELLARYPKDPRSHLIRAVYFVDEQRLSEAEAELRATITLASAQVAGHVVRLQAQAFLALVLAEQGRNGEAKSLAAETCRSKELATTRRSLEKAKLCS